MQRGPPRAQRRTDCWDLQALTGRRRTRTFLEHAPPPEVPMLVEAEKLESKDPMERARALLRQKVAK